VHAKAREARAAKIRSGMTRRSERKWTHGSWAGIPACRKDKCGTNACIFLRPFAFSDCSNGIWTICANRNSRCLRRRDRVGLAPTSLSAAIARRTQTLFSWKLL